MLRDKVIAECNFVTSGQDNYLQVIKNVNDYFLTLIVPKNLDGNNKNNVVIQFQVQFSELCIALMSNGIPDPETMTVFRFYSALKFFESKRKPQKE
jgi:hypothetical protein